MTLVALIFAAALAVAAVVVLARLGVTRGALERGQDEAARARAETALAERRLGHMLDDLPLMAMRIDDAGRVVASSAAARERFPFLEPGIALLEGFGDHELAGRAEDALATLVPVRFEVRLFAQGRRTYRVSVTPHRVGDAREALVVLTDASEVVAYQELRAQFVANVSHELRTPITGLRGLLEALGDPDMDPATHARFVARAAAETERLEALISDILFLSELEAAAEPPAGASSDLCDVVRATIEELEALAAEAGVTLDADVDGPVWTPLTDRMARTVARNLLENAIRYAGPGASATARVRRLDGHAELVVADDGAGIPERHLPHVFERFYRADPSRSRRLGGTGLGLSIVKHIAERFGGRAEAVSREGFGTRVAVTLPIAEPDGGDAGMSGGTP